MFSDSPATKTAGRYYVSPAGTPFVSVPHHYGSRNWYDANYEKTQTLGESLTTRQTWYRGDGPAVKPNPEQIGKDSCISEGALIGQALGTDDMREGFINACFTPGVDLDPLWETASSFDVCALQFFYATLLCWSQRRLNAKMTTAFRMLLGDDVTTFWAASVSPTPNVMICKMPTFSVVVVDGTPDFQTLAMQAFALIERPQNFGIISTYSLWYSVSTYVHNLCGLAGVDKDAPIFLVGYSMGGAVVDILAARYYAANSKRKIRTLTFGSPKPGDERLSRILSKTTGISIANEEDIVCSVPPSQLIIFPAAVALSMPGLFVWEDWIREPNRARQSINGEITMNVDPLIDTPLLIHLVEQILALQPFDIVAPHFIDEYRRRIEVRCPQTQWPISDALWNYLQKCEGKQAAGDADLAIELVGAGVAVHPGVMFCSCCGNSPSPMQFIITMSSADYPELDGVSFRIFTETGPPSCVWFALVPGFDENLGVAISDWDPEAGLPLRGELTWNSGTHGLVNLVHLLTFDEFACSPWGFDFTDTTTEDGIPTSKHIRFVGAPGALSHSAAGDADLAVELVGAGVADWTRGPITHSAAGDADLAVELDGQAAAAHV